MALDDAGKKNALIIQGRLLREGSKKATMTISEWFELYNELLDVGEIKGDQERIAGDLAKDLMAIQIASQLQASADGAA